MRQILINKPDGTRYYPMINQNTGGGINCLTEAPPFYIENLTSEECLVTLTKSGSPNAITLNYSIDKQKTWTTLSMAGVTSGSFSIPPNGKVYLKGNNSTFSTSDKNYYVFSFSQQCNIGGKLMSLVGDNDIASFMFYKLFYQNVYLVNAENLILPNNVAFACYASMFQNCTSLVNAPALPATTLADYCYCGMFAYCKSLLNAPKLPATTLAAYCYFEMFYGCTSLVNAPALPATTLADYCYQNMFHSCTSLVNAPVLPATTLADYCYFNMFKNCTSLVNAPALPAVYLYDHCYSGMFRDCTSLVNAPAFFATNLNNCCCTSMFRDCTSLVNAPVLPATTLVSSCYNLMFQGCTNLNYVKAMFIDTPSDFYTKNWLLNVASSGTFVKNASATWDVTGGNGIPSGWTVETAVA